MNPKTQILSELKSSLVMLGRAITPQMFVVPSPEFHHEMSDALLDKRNEFVNIIAPRGHAKSSIVACLRVIHHLMFDEGKKVVLLSSKSEGHAIKLLATIKDVLDYSPTFRALFGYWGRESASKWDERQIFLKDGSAIFTRGTGQQVVGIKHINQRPTLIVLDDPEDLENTKTEERMQMNLKWLLTQLLPSRDPQRSQVVVIGTPQHANCMVFMLKNLKGWKNLHYKAIKEDGTALWQEWMSLEKLQAEKERLSSIGKVSYFYREYMCEIIGDEDQLFKETYFQWWEGNHFIAPNGQTYLNIIKPEQKVIPVNIFMGVDPASSIRDTADFSVIFPVAVDKMKNRYCLPYFRGRVTPMALGAKVIEYYHLYRPKKTRIESVGYQEMLREYVRSKEIIPGLEIKELPRSSKSVRLESMEPMFATKKVYLQKDMQTFVDELLLYPRAKHDDIMDGFFYATKQNYPPEHADNPQEELGGKFLWEHDTKKSWMRN